MKRDTILTIVAIILMAIAWGPWLLLLLIVIPIAYFGIKYTEKLEPTMVTYANTEEVELKYGQPDDVVVLDASRANELSALILGEGIVRQIRKQCGNTRRDSIHAVRSMG